MEEVVGVDFEDFVLVEVDGLEFVGLYYFVGEEGVVVLHLVEVVGGDVAEEGEAVDELVEAELEVGVHGEGEHQRQQEVYHHRHYREVAEDHVLPLRNVLVVVQEELVQALHFGEVVEQLVQQGLVDFCLVEGLHAFELVEQPSRQVVYVLQELVGEHLRFPLVHYPKGGLFEVGVEPVLGELGDVGDQPREAVFPERVDVVVDQSGGLKSGGEFLVGSVEELGLEDIGVAVADLSGLHDVALGAVGEEDALDFEQHLLVAVEGHEVDD